jgi:hypothetical protein
MLSLTGIIFPCDLLVLLLMNSQDNEKLRALQIAQGVNRGKSRIEAYQGLVDSLSHSSVATAKQLSTWVENTTRNEPHPKLLVYGIRCAVMWERHGSKCRFEFATLDPVLIALLCLVAMFKLLRSVKENLPDIFDMGVPKSTRTQRKRDLLSAWISKVTEESGLDGTW